jgi:hypothetical protein
MLQLFQMLRSPVAVKAVTDVPVTKPVTVATKKVTTKKVTKKPVVKSKKLRQQLSLNKKIIKKTAVLNSGFFVPINFHFWC